MPVIYVNVWEGFGEERIKTVIKNITKVFVDLGVPAHAVEVIVQEIQDALGNRRRTSLGKIRRINFKVKEQSIIHEGRVKN